MKINDPVYSIEVRVVRDSSDRWPDVAFGAYPVEPRRLLITFYAHGPDPRVRALEVHGLRRYANGQTAGGWQTRRFVGRAISDELWLVLDEVWKALHTVPLPRAEAAK